MKTSVLAAALMLSTVVLAACGETAEAPAATEGTIAGMTVTNARLVLPAVSGNPAAVYFDIAYDGDRQIALNRATVDGAASAEFHQYGEWAGEMQMQAMQPLPLKKGDKVKFEPGGNHLMAMEPGAALVAGGTTEVTLKVSGGATHTFPAEIRAAGEER